MNVVAPLLVPVRFWVRLSLLTGLAPVWSYLWIYAVCRRPGRSVVCFALLCVCALVACLDYARSGRHRFSQRRRLSQMSLWQVPSVWLRKAPVFAVVYFPCFVPKDLAVGELTCGSALSSSLCEHFPFRCLPGAPLSA